MLPGVKQTKHGKYVAQIYYKKQQIYLGTFYDEEEAHDAYREAWETFHDRPYARASYERLTPVQRLERAKESL